MKKVILKGPLLSDSEYGVLAREVFEDIKGSDVDLYLLNTNWGNSGWISGESEFRDDVDKLIMKTSSYVTNDKSPRFDLSIQVDRPSGWIQMADKNIGVTNEPSTVKVPDEWNSIVNHMDSIVVGSDSRKASFSEDCQAKIEVVSRKVLSKNTNYNETIKLSTDYNFLSSIKWETKNNVEQVITSFLQEFQNESVGLILDTYIKNKSVIDREYTYEHLKELASLFPKNRKCKVYILHGSRNDEVIYGNKKIGAYIDLCHTMEHSTGTYNALRFGIPVISTKWGTTQDLPESSFLTVSSSFDNLKERHVSNPKDKNLDLIWNYANIESVREKMREAYNNGTNRKFDAYEYLVNKNINQNENMSYNKLINNLMENKDETK